MKKERADKVHIAGWVTPMPMQKEGGKDFCNQHQYDLIAGCGIRDMYAIFERSAVEIDGKNACERALEYASKAGVGYYVWDDEIARLLLESDERTVKEYVKKYEKFSAYRGVLLKDEPNVEQLAWVKQARDKWNEYFPDKDCYTNLFPSHVERSLAKLEEGDTWEETYVKAYLKDGAQRLSYDLYPLLIEDDGSISQQKEFLHDLEFCAEAAKEAGVPMWVFIQSLSYSKWHRHPDEAALRWQIMSAFAYGAKGIQHFCYWPPTEDAILTVKEGFVTRDGEPTSVYEAAKKIHQEIFAFEKDYTQYDYVGVMPIRGSQPVGKNFTYDLLQQPMQSHDKILGVEATQDTLVGALQNEGGRDAFFIVNYCDPYYHQKDEVTLKLNGVNKMDVYVRGEKRRLVSDDGTFTFTIEAGDGIFAMLTED
ncbi:MAG: hypothetical protein IJY11_01325 [Clostridia bacterium]|nr:hypothetical protein [Clostridia bacterium]